MIWVKRLTLALLALLLVLVIAIAALLYTPAGIKVALWGAQKALPALSVGSSSGSLMKGFALEQVRYQDGTLDLAVNRLGLTIDDGCLLTPAVCVKELAIDGTRFSMPEVPPPSEEEEPASEPVTTITLPLPISIDRIALNDVALDILGNKIAWDTFSTAAKMEGNQVTIMPTDWDGVSVSLAPAAENASAAAEIVEQSEPQPIVLPEVVIPLNIAVERFTVKSFSLEGEAPQKVELLDLVASTVGSEVQIDKLVLKAPQGTLDAKANVTLSGDYPLTLDAKLDVAMAPLAGHKLALKASGSAVKLGLDASLSGTIDALVKGQLSPLDPDLPFDVSVSSKNIQWPIDSDAEFTVKDTALTAKGKLSGYSFSLKSNIDGKPMPAVKADLQGKGSLNDVALSRLMVETLGGTVSGSASASWKDLVNWQGELAFSHIQPGLEWPDVPGDISGKLKTSGGLTKQGGWYVELPALTVDGIVMDQRLDMKGELSASDRSGKGNLTFNTPGLSIKHGPNGLLAKGNLSDTWDMLAIIDAPNLAQSMPGLRGKVQGRVDVRGKMAEPDLALDLTGQALGWQDLANLDKLTIKGKVKPMPALDADLQVLASDGRFDTFNLANLALIFRGTEQRHELTLKMDAEPVSADLRLTGALNREQGWQGRLEKGEIDTEIGPWKLDRSTPIGYQFKTQLATVAAHCWKQDKSALCLSENLTAGASGRAKLAVNNFDFAIIKPFLPENVELQGALGAHVDATWAPNSAPFVQANIALPAGFVKQKSEPDGQPMMLGWDKVTLNAEVKQDVLNADWLIAVKDNGDLSGRARVTQLTGEQQIEANLKLDRFMLDFLQPLVADYDKFGGQIDANLNLSGPAMHPAVNGLVKVSKVQAIGRKVPLDIKNADITATFSGYQAQLNGKIVTPDGNLALAGDANWRDMANWATQLRVNGRELEVNMPPMLAVRVSPDLTIKAGPQQAEITGKVEIPWGRITVDQLPESAVAVSDDEILLTADLKPVEKESAMPFSVKTNVLVRIGDDVRLSAFGLKSNLVGDLNVRQNDKGPQVFGEVNLKDGTYRSFGQTLVIRKGQLLFNGPADQPYLSIEAIRDPENIEDDVIAGIRVTGPADNPKADIFSDPAMPQQNALSYILRGRDLDSESNSGDAMTMALISMGLAQGGQLVGNIGEAFGVQDLSLDTAGSGDDSQVTISGYIAPGLQVKYGVGIFNSIGEFTVRYRLMKDLYVEVVSGLDSAVDLLYQFEFN